VSRDTRVLTYGDLAFIEGALTMLLLDGGHPFAAIAIGVLAATNLLLHAVAVVRGRPDEC